MREVKQVIVMRKDLGMRAGKMVAQGAHASNAASLRWSGTDIFNQWSSQGTTKICVRVESEEELLAICERARAANLHPVIIKDSGKTEFNGVPTLTCLAIGPCWADEVDGITGHLKLL